MRKSSKRHEAHKNRNTEEEDNRNTKSDVRFEILAAVTEDYVLVGRMAVQFGERQKLRRNILLLSSR
jgi:hypothetical protein